MRIVLRQIKQRVKSEAGAASIMAVVLLSLFGFGLAALVIDTSILYAKRAELVTAADAAALAAVGVIREEVAKGHNPESETVKLKAEQAALDYAVANGSDPEKTLIFVGKRDVELRKDQIDFRQVVDVTVAVEQKNIFATFLNDPESTVSASATATWGYVYASTIGNILPLFIFDMHFTADTAVLLHEKIQDGNNNYGYLDLDSGMSAIKEALAGRMVDGIYVHQNMLDGKSGAGESFPDPVEERMKDALLKGTAEERRNHMTGLVPVINWERFNAIEDNYKNENGDYAPHLKLPIEYFAYFEIIDVIEKNAPMGSAYALDPDNQYKQVTMARNYQDMVGSKPSSGLLYGEFTGEIVKARTLAEVSDQINPAPEAGGAGIAAMYAQLIG